jgi:UDP-glucuronate decarboxylase
VDRHQQEDVEMEKTVEMPEKGDDDESHDEDEEEEPVQKSDIQSKPIGLPNSKQDAKEQLSQISTADKQSTELEENDLTDAQRRFVETQKLIASQSIPTSTTPHVMKTPNLPDAKRKKVLVTGGAGFVGSHLVDKLMMEGHEVIVLDNFFTGQRKNIEHWMHHPHFSLVVHDVTEPIMLEVDEIYHLACPASPPHYQYNPVKTIKTSTMGTINMLGLAKRVKAKILLTSTSEVSELCCCFVLWFV